MHDKINTQARPQAVKDFLGSKVADQLPALMMDATHRGPVLSVANSVAILAALGTGPHRVAVADISQGHLAGVQDVLRLAGQASSQGEWLAAVKKRHGALGDKLGVAIQRAGGSASFERLQERVRNDQIDLFHIDLTSTDQAARMRAASGGGFAAMYTSNIEVYVGGFMNKDTTSAGQRQQDLDNYRANVLGMMRPDTQFVRGFAPGPMEIMSTTEAQGNWHPQAE